MYPVDFDTLLQQRCKTSQDSKREVICEYDFLKAHLLLEYEVCSTCITACQKYVK